METTITKPARKASTKKATPAKKSPAKKSAAKKIPAKKTATSKPATKPARKTQNSVKKAAPKSTPATPSAWPYPTSAQMAVPAPQTSTPAKRGTTRKPAETKPDAGKSKAKAAQAVAAVQFVSRKMQPGQALTVIAEGPRPRIGTALYAHTHAALTVLGLLDASMPAIPIKAVLTLMGQTAVSYHIAQRNFERAKDDKVRLTLTGYNKFRERKIDGALGNAYVSLFLDGTIDKSLNLREGQTFKAGVGI